MNDVMERLAALRPAPEPATDEIVARDIGRGRRAQTRRRTVRGAKVGAVALAVAGVAGATTLGQEEPGTGLDLVTYEGPQLPGFTVTKVPEGFVLQGASSHHIAVARPADTSTIDDFRDKLIVTLEPTENLDEQAASPRPARPRVINEGDRYRIELPDGTVRYTEDDTLTADDLSGGTPAPSTEYGGEPFQVDGDDATLRTNPDGVKVLEYEHDDRTVVVQMWAGLGLTEEELREFADGISVTSEAQVSIG